MAKQKSLIKLKGTIGDITFYKTADGFVAREKTTLDGSRIATDPSFQRTRENGQEFGRAGKAGKLLRDAFRTVVQASSDSKMVSRLTSAMIKVIQADAVNARGLRNVIDGEAELLEGFEFNIQAPLQTILFAPFSTSMDRTTGAISLTLPVFVPSNAMAAPTGATHFKIIAAGAAIDFENGNFIGEVQETALLPMEQATTLQTLTTHVGANTTHPLFLVVAIEFSQEVNGFHYPLKGSSYNACTLVKVSGM
jgi:hypothetical protein